MSPRFERRPDKRTGAGGGRGARSTPSSRPYGRDRRADPAGQSDRGRQGRTRPDWGERDSGRGPLRGSERRPGRGGDRSSDRAGEGAWAAARRFSSARPETRRFDRSRRDGARSDGGRPEARRQPLLRREPAAAPPAVPAEAERLGQPAPSDDMVWGRHAALAALESGRPIHRIWCTPELRFSPRFLQQLREAKASGVLVEEVTWARLGQLTAGAVHQGIVLQTAAADTLDLESLIEGCGGIGEPPLLMALDGITDPHNLGAIARSAEALGAHGLVLPQRRSAGLTGSVAKVAAGALEHLPVARVVNLNRSLERLKQEGYRVVGLASEGSVSLEQADLDGPLVIVTGSEGDGLSMLTRRHCDQLVSIPLRGATPSLNASVATAVLLYEVARRGWMRGLRGGDPAPRLVRPQLPSRVQPPPPEQIGSEPQPAPIADEPQPEPIPRIHAEPIPDGEPTPDPALEAPAALPVDSAGPEADTAPAASTERASAEPVSPEPTSIEPTSSESSSTEPATTEPVTAGPGSPEAGGSEPGGSSPPAGERDASTPEPALDLGWTPAARSDFATDVDLGSLRP